MFEKLEIYKKKIIYRASYRGTKEMDILLTKFVKKYLDIFDEEQLKNLEKFLEFEDEVIKEFYSKGINKDNINKNPISLIFKNFKL